VGWSELIRLGQQIEICLFWTKIFAHFTSVLSFSSFLSLLSVQIFIMGVQREPGQKGVSWSNIAVGVYTATWIYTAHVYMV